MLSRAGFLVWGLSLYSKPHLTFDQQLALLEARGLRCDDHAKGIALLRAVGYYRLSAYVYPFREMLPEGEQCVQSPVHYRSSRIVEGTSLEDVQQLWLFDRRLRSRVLDGLEIVEVGLRTQIAYVAGARDPFAHLKREHLDEQACSERRPSTEGASTDAFEDWVERYEKLQAHAKNEDYVRHQLAKYGGPLPIWIALEFLDFGALSRLYGLLDRRDQNAVARELGVRNGRQFAQWLKTLGYVRNLAAHHSRLWNRTLTLKIGKFRPETVTADLRHAADMMPRDKLYVSLAVTAQLTKQIHPGTRWHVHLRDDVRKFPTLPTMSPERDMGFPVGWDQLPLWKPEG